MTAQKNKLRLSYSKLNSFANYDKQQAIDIILGKTFPTTPEMEFGSQAHKQIELDQLDLEGIGEGGVYEEKKVAEIYDWLDLAFVCDRRKGNVIVDYKTGSGKPMQLYVYAFLYRLLDIEIDEGRIVYVDFDPATKEVTKKTQRKYPIGPEQLEEAWYWIDETAHEIKVILEDLKYNW
jgi:hypothetical protein